MTRYDSREAWLAGRGSGIGASEIGTVLGYTAKTPIQLWREKIGSSEPEDLSDNERVQFGNAAEDVLRDMFRLMRPEYKLDFEPYTVYRQDGEHDFLFYTPDGILTETETGRRGLYESKTATLLSRADSDRWWQKVPEHYFTQICQGMFCADLSFAIIWALLRDREGDAQLRAYRFDRPDCERKIEEIKREGKRFWRHVLDGTMPSQPLLL